MLRSEAVVRRRGIASSLLDPFPTMASLPTRPAILMCMWVALVVFVVPVRGQSVTDLVLVNAETNQELQSLSDGDVLQLDDASSFTVRATADGSTESVRFSFAGQSNYQTENTAPYALGGDDNGDYFAVPELSETGTYTLDATPYPESDAGGTAGTSLQIEFTVEASGSSPSGCSSDGTDSPVVTGTSRRWHPVTVVVDGPCSSEKADPNPFLDYRFSVTFTHENSGTVVTVPGYFAADGNAANTGATSGTKWYAHFLPRETGTWSFETSFREGADVAISLDASAGSPTSYDGQTGSLTIQETDKSGRDHRGKGLLRAVSGQRYLQFDDGTFFLKGGADSPENLLAYTAFDGTTNNGGTDYVRDYNHSQDWNSGDPTWKNGLGKGLIGALNYLAGKGMTAFSFLTMNVNGDGNDVWPWISPGSTLRYDVSKLAQWEIVFSHADAVGLFKHFKTQETENDQYLDDGDLGTERKLYYRELIARFGHHHALNWNLGEEYDVYREKNDGDQSRLKSYADYIRALDPYAHPIVVHTYPGQRDDVYPGLLGFENFTGPSIQLSNMSDSEANDAVQRWISASAAAGNLWNVSVDEPGNANAGLQPDSDDNHDEAREVLWAVFFAGGDGLEWYFGYQYPDDDLDADDWRSRDQFWDDHRYALDLMRRLPFPTMQADNSRLGGESGYVFSDGAEVFAAYLSDGGSQATLDLPDGTFNVRWFNPRSGGDLQTGEIAQVDGGTDVAVGAPPSDSNSDWVVLVSRPDSAIPVEMSSFEAQRSGRRVLLSWTTASESQNAGFEVQHKPVDATAWSTLSFVDGQGTTNEPQSYRFETKELSYGEHTFRLQQMDTDGTTSLSSVVRIELVLDDTHALSSVYPNPARSVATVDLAVQQAQDVSVEVFDLLGRRLETVFTGRMSANRTHSIPVTIRSLPSGVYFLHVKGESFTESRRLMVVK